MRAFSISRRAMLIVILFMLVIIICHLVDSKTAGLMYSWSNQEVKFPDSLLVYCDHFEKKELLSAYISANEPKIVVFTDAQCSNCLFLFSQWNELVERYEDYAQFVFIFKTNSLLSLKTNLELQNFEHPVVIDCDDEYRASNNYNDNLLNTLLIDSNNHIVAMGNPIQFRKLIDLYDSILH